MDGGMDGRNARRNDWMNGMEWMERVGRMAEGMNEWMDVWMHVWMNEKNERMNKYKNNKNK